MTEQGIDNYGCEYKRTDDWGYGRERYNQTECIMQYIENMPSAERKKGKWIKMSDADGTYWCCSECGEELYRPWSFNIFPKKESIDKTNFCPNCGADMRGEEK